MFGITACSSSSRDEEPAGIMVSIAPQKFFAEQLLDGQLPVYIMLPPGSSPATYEPSPSEMARLENALAYFRIGYIGFELAWMDRIKEVYPDLTVYDLSENIPLLSGHQHVQHGDHTHHVEGTDPHIWMSPQRARGIVENTRNALLEILPSASDSISSRADNLILELEMLDDTLRQIFNDSANRSFAILHPSLSYLAEDYGLEQLSIEFEGKEPSPARLKEVVERIQKNGISKILVQREFSQEQAKAIAGITGAEIVMIDPLAEDWKSSLLQIASLIAGTDNEVKSENNGELP